MDDHTPDVMTGRGNRDGKKNNIVKITIEYKQKPAYGTKSWTVELDGNETWAIVTDPEIADAIFKLSGVKGSAEKPSNGHGPNPKSMAQAGKDEQDRQEEHEKKGKPLTEPGEDPDCCFYVNGKWVCW